MKKFFAALCCILLTGAIMGCTKKITKVEVTLTPNYGDRTERTVYQGSAESEKIKPLLLKLSNAEETMQMTMDLLPEGEYHIKCYDGEKIIESWTVINPRNVRSELNGKLYFCELEEELSRLQVN